MSVDYYHNLYDENTHTATSAIKDKVKILDPKECEGIAFYLPTPKSPHGIDVDPTGEYLVGNGKLSADMAVHSFTKMLAAIDNKDYEKVIDGIPVLSFDKNSCRK